MNFILYLQKYGALSFIPLLLAYFVVRKKSKSVAYAILYFAVFDLLLVGLMYAGVPASVVVIVGGAGAVVLMAAAYITAYKRFGLKKTVLKLVLIPLLTITSFWELVPWECRILSMVLLGMALLAVIWPNVKKHGVRFCLPALPFLVIAFPLIFWSNLVAHRSLFFLVMIICCGLSNYIDNKIKMKERKTQLDEDAGAPPSAPQDSPSE